MGRRASAKLSDRVPIPIVFFSQNSHRLGVPLEARKVTQMSHMYTAKTMLHQSKGDRKKAGTQSSQLRLNS